MNIRISAARATLLLLGIVAVLQLLNVVGQVSKHVLGHGSLLGFVNLFFVDREGNVPAWYSSLALLLCAGLLALIAASEHARGGPWTTRWAALAATFAFLAFDEAVSLHEMLILPLRTMLGATGLLYWTWVLVGAAVVLVVFVGSLPLLRALPRPTAARFLVAGAVFVSGAIGVECLSGVDAEHHGTSTALCAFLVTVEESLEMLGVVLFVRALLLHLATHCPRIELTFEAATARG